MEKHLTHPDHPRFEPDKWNDFKNTKKGYIQKSHNCYAYAMNTIKKDYIKKCKKYVAKTEKKKDEFLKKLGKEYENIYDTWDWYLTHVEQHKDRFCPYVRPQLGVYSGTVHKYYKSFSDLTVKNVKKMLKKDNPKIIKLKKNQQCPYGFYKIFVMIWKSRDKDVKEGDYHFIRQDKTGSWSHKNGAEPVKLLIEKDPYEYVKNQKKKNKDISYGICGYYAVPIKGKKNLGTFYKDL